MSNFFIGMVGGFIIAFLGEWLRKSKNGGWALTLLGSLILIVSGFCWLLEVVGIL